MLSDVSGKNKKYFFIIIIKKNLYQLKELNIKENLKISSK